ncbi:MAG: TadE/TadG family type IV pilus assembly protein, partial [Pseudomonadota bacterium]
MRLHLWTKLFDFQHNKSGNVAMLYALSVLPIFAVAGFAIDYERQVTMQHRVQVGLDAAALATSLRQNETGGLEPEELNRVAQEFFDGNFMPNAQLMGST